MTSCVASGVWRLEQSQEQGLNLTVTTPPNNHCGIKPPASPRFFLLSFCPHPLLHHSLSDCLRWPSPAIHSAYAPVSEFHTTRAAHQPELSGLLRQPRIEPPTDNTWLRACIISQTALRCRYLHLPSIINFHTSHSRRTTPPQP